MQFYWETFINLVDGVKLITILALIAVDFLLGVIIAIKEGKFQLAKIAEFLNTSVLYFLGGYFLLGIAATVEPQIGGSVVTGAWALLDLTMIGFLVDKAKKLGLPIPDKIGFVKFTEPPATSATRYPMGTDIKTPPAAVRPGDAPAPSPPPPTKSPWQ